MRASFNKTLIIIVFNITLAVANGSYASTLTVTVADHKGKALADAVVTLRTLDEAISAQQSTTAIIDQIDKEFVPEVSVIQTGTAVSFPNNDDILHHVYSFSETKSFDLPLYEGTPSDPVTFDKPGLVTLGCNIHDWMRAYVVVVDTPFYKITGIDGLATIENLPVGDYELEVWHPRQRKLLLEKITIEEPITKEFKVAVKPQLRSRRHSSDRDGNYN